jgi:hypothetical protein
MSTALVWNMIGLSGVALVISGVWMVYQPAGFILGGAVLLAVAILLSPRGGDVT